MTALKRLILWEYQRGVWQYDVMCAIIILFIAFAPPAWFHDQPRIQYASQISEGVFWIEPELVNLSKPEAARLDDLSRALTLRTGKKQKIARLEPIVDSEKEIKGYMAYTRP
ncbi:MAG: hypothetical protein KGN84_17625 [Acidobacteriota bacterium]|nr:hypothetical protein [Acidobacteriota bacterium]